MTDSSHRQRPAGDQDTAAGQPQADVGAAVSDARVLRVIQRYATADRDGRVLAPADILYRLTAWHHIEITREQLAEVLRTRAHLRP